MSKFGILVTTFTLTLAFMQGYAVTWEKPLNECKFMQFQNCETLARTGQRWYNQELQVRLTLTFNLTVARIQCTVVTSKVALFIKYKQ